MVNYSGSWNGGLFTYDGTVLHDGDRFKTTIDREWWIDYQSPTGGMNFTGDYLPSGSFVAITAVPEPSPLVLMAIGAGLMTSAARRRVRSMPVEDRLQPVVGRATASPVAHGHPPRQYLRLGTPKALRARFVPAQSRFVTFSALSAKNPPREARFRGKEFPPCTASVSCSQSCSSPSRA